MEFNLVAPSDRRYRFRRKGLRDYLDLAANRAADDVVMARRTGEITAKMNERGFPYLVDIRVPAGGLGRRVDAMYAWHNARGVLSRHGTGGLFVARFCFAKESDADAFAAEFGGAAAKCALALLLRGTRPPSRATRTT